MFLIVGFIVLMVVMLVIAVYLEEQDKNKYRGGE